MRIVWDLDSMCRAGPIPAEGVAWPDARPTEIPRKKSFSRLHPWAIIAGTLPGTFVMASSLPAVFLSLVRSSRVAKCGHTNRWPGAIVLFGFLLALTASA